MDESTSLQKAKSNIAEQYAQMHSAGRREGSVVGMALDSIWPTPIPTYSFPVCLSLSLLGELDGVGNSGCIG